MSPSPGQNEARQMGLSKAALTGPDLDVHYILLKIVQFLLLKNYSELDTTHVRPVLI